MLIILVIDDHVSTRIGFFSSVFPYNSFYMPLFVIISGYFYKKRSFFENFKHKVKKLLLPYILWCIIGNAVAWLFCRLDIVYWNSNITYREILELLLFKPISDVNGAGWFAIMLFWVSIVYDFLRKIIFKDNIIADLCVLVMTVLCGMLSVYYCINCDTKSVFTTVILRLMFFIQFFHLGVILRRYLEQYLITANTMLLCLACVIVNVTLLCIYGDEINFYSTCYMNDFNSVYLPLITTLSGSVFWYKLMSFCASRIGENKYVSFLADNTFTIMMSHLFFVNIPNFYANSKALSGNTFFSDFNVDAFKSSAWVRYTSESLLIGFFCGIGGSLLVCCILAMCKGMIKRLMRMASNQPMRLQ